MTRPGRLVLSVAFLATSALAAPNGPDIRVIDNKISIKAENVPLGRMLRLLDFATGMTSKVPPELSNRNVSVQFSDLDVHAAVRKIFEGQKMDYIFIDGQGVFVTAVSQSGPATVRSGAPTPFPRDPSPFEPQPGFPPEQPNFANNPVVNPAGGQVDPFGNQPQPAVIQTPFGPIPNPRFNQQGSPSNAPLSGPGGAAPFGGATPFAPGVPYTPGGTGVQGLPANPFGSPGTLTSPGAGAIAPITTPPLVPQQLPK